MEDRSCERVQRPGQTSNLSLCGSYTHGYLSISVPQLADAKDVMQAVNKLEGIRLPVLTPNLKVHTSGITRVECLFLDL